MAPRKQSKSVEVKKTKPAASASKAAVPASEGSTYPLGNLRREMDRLFEDFEANLPSFGFGRSMFDMEPFRRLGHAFEAELPSVDLTETNDAFTLTAEMPGLEEKDVDVTLSDDMLTVSGEKQEESTREEDDHHISERRYGSFKRSFRLPASVEDDKISAALTNGVLTVTLPKSAEAKAKVKKIDVKAK